MLHLLFSYDKENQGYAMYSPCLQTSPEVMLRNKSSCSFGSQNTSTVKPHLAHLEQSKALLTFDQVNLSLNRGNYSITSK